MMYSRVRCNIKNTLEVCSPASKIPMIRFETLVDYFAHEPALINVYKEPTSTKAVCEPIFRISINVPNLYYKSFTVYSNERESFGDGCYMALRRIIWDKKSDIEKLKTEEREKRLTLCPSVYVDNVVTYEQKPFINLFEIIDKCTRNGIQLDHRQTKTSGWRDLSIMRRYEWGEISSSWGPSMQNPSLENLIFDIMERLEIAIQYEYPMIEKIELDYRYPANQIKQLLYGDIVCDGING